MKWKLDRRGEHVHACLWVRLAPHSPVLHGFWSTILASFLAQSRLSSFAHVHLQALMHCHPTRDAHALTHGPVGQEHMFDGVTFAPEINPRSRALGLQRYASKPDMRRPWTAVPLVDHVDPK